MLSVTAAWGRTFATGELNFEVISESDRTVRVLSSTVDAPGTITTLTIPGEVADPSDGTRYKVIEVGQGAFKGRTINSMTVEAGEGDLWFAREAMASASLSSLSVSRDFASPVSHEPFFGLDMLTSLTLGEGITHIPFFAFYKTSIGAVRIPKSVESIGYGAFESSTVKVTFSFGGNLKYIAGEAFAGCSKLSLIDIPEGVISIGEMAFDGSSITSVYLPATLQTIGVNAFTGCSRLTWMSVSSSNPNFSYSQGFLMSADRKTVYQAINYNRQLSVPAGVTTIAESAFQGLDVEAVTLPMTVTTIGDYAFCECRSLSSINLSSTGVTTIGEKAFAMCNKLTTLTLPETLRSIGKSCFMGLPVTTINIPASLTEIPERAFELSTLTSITIPETVYRVGDNAFERCFSLESVKFGDTWGTVRQIAPQTFIGCKALNEVKLPAFVQTIGDEAFSGCTSLTSILLPGPLKEIGEKAFDGIPDLAEVSSCAVEPPSLPINAFANNVYRNAKLKVPVGLKSVYGAAPVWELFGNTEESAELSGVNDITTDDLDGDITVYRLDGIRVYQGPSSRMPAVVPGIYIVNGRKVRL